MKTICGLLYSVVKLPFRISDYLCTKKLPLIFMMATGGTSFTVFALICNKTLPYDTPLLFLVCILGGLALIGSVPLFLELAVTTGRPGSEGLNTGLMLFSSNVYSVLFLSLPVFQRLGTKWINWMLVGSCLVCVVSLLVLREPDKEKEHKRTVPTRKGASVV